MPSALRASWATSRTDGSVHVLMRRRFVHGSFRSGLVRLIAEDSGFLLKHGPRPHSPKARPHRSGDASGRWRPVPGKARPRRSRRRVVRSGLRWARRGRGGAPLPRSGRAGVASRGARAARQRSIRGLVRSFRARGLGVCRRGVGRPVRHVAGRGHAQEDRRRAGRERSISSPARACSKRRAFARKTIPPACLPFAMRRRSSSGAPCRSLPVSPKPRRLR